MESVPQMSIWPCSLLISKPQLDSSRDVLEIAYFIVVEAQPSILLVMEIDIERRDGLPDSCANRCGDAGDIYCSASDSVCSFGTEYLVARYRKLEGGHAGIRPGHTCSFITGLCVLDTKQRRDAGRGKGVPGRARCRDKGAGAAAGRAPGPASPRAEWSPRAASPRTELY